MFNFVEDVDAITNIPTLEKARADYAPYYSASQRVSEQQAQEQVRNEMGKLGGGITAFRPGYFDSKQGKRYGYVIEFVMHGTLGRIPVAGLPISKQETMKKIAQVRVQALLNVRDWLKVSVTSQVFTPGNALLMQYLLVDGNVTMLEYMQAYHRLPELPMNSGNLLEG